MNIKNYRNTPKAIRDLIREKEVHKDLYLSLIHI